MNMLGSLMWNAIQTVQGICQLARYVLTFLFAMLQPKAILATVPPKNSIPSRYRRNNNDLRELNDRGFSSDGAESTINTWFSISGVSA